MPSYRFCPYGAFGISRTAEIRPARFGSLPSGKGWTNQGGYTLCNEASRRSRIPYVLVECVFHLCNRRDRDGRSDVLVGTRSSLYGTQPLLTLRPPKIVQAILR